MDILITMIAVALIFLSGIGIGAAITDRIITREEDSDDRTDTETGSTETIGGQDDTAGSQNAVDI